jgi:glycerophosphoryl diester phosphodiesterase
LELPSKWTPSLPFGRTDASRTPPWLTAKPFTHRGLHGGAIVENSRAAFEAAVAAGFGIELDVQASACGTPFVFHDSDLVRLCGRNGRIGALDRAALAAILLSGTDEPIPTLEDVLAIVAGRTPLLIEVKAERRFSPHLCRSVAATLASYDGPAAVMSFHPGAVRWFAGHSPDVIRGLVVTEQDKDFRHLMLQRLVLRWATPDFLAYDIRSLPSARASAARARGLPLLTWTVRTPAERERAALHADQSIFERA